MKTSKKIFNRAEKSVDYWKKMYELAEARAAKCKKLLDDSKQVSSTNETLYYIIRKNNIWMKESYTLQNAKKILNKMIKEDQYNGNQYELVELFSNEKILETHET